MALIVVIGPSGVGKTTYGQRAATDIERCQFVDLDAAVSASKGCPAGDLLPRIGADRFSDVSRDVLLAISGTLQAGQTIIVAVGAGSLESSRAESWLFRGPTITVTAKPEQVFARGGARNAHRDLAQFEATEFSSARQRLYRRADCTLDVSDLGLEDAQARFTQLVRGLLQSHP